MPDLSVSRLFRSLSRRKRFEHAKHLKILDFPNEILLMIVECLECAKDVSSLSLTNRRLANICGKPLYDYATKDVHGMSPLHWAAYKGYESLARLVLSTTNVNSVCRVSSINSDPVSWTPLHFAATKPECSPVFQFLLDNGADVNARDHFGRTALHYTAFYNYKERTKILIERGIEINIPENETSRTALHGAAAVGADEIVALLLAAGADYSLRDDWAFLLHSNGGLTALDHAYQYQRTKSARLLANAAGERFHSPRPHYRNFHINVLCTCYILLILILLPVWIVPALINSGLKWVLARRSRVGGFFGTPEKKARGIPSPPWAGYCRD